MWQFASPSNESDLTCPNCREDCASHVQIRTTPPREQSDPHKVMRGCASHMNIRTMPQRERSDTHTVTRGLHEPYQNSHCATTRAIWPTQSDERVEWFQPLLRRGLQSTAPATKNESVAKPAKHFVRACTIEIHMDISQGNFCARNYIKMGGDQMAHPDLTPAFIMAPYIPSPLSVDTLFRYVLRSSNSRKLVWCSLHTETTQI